MIFLVKYLTNLLSVYVPPPPDSLRQIFHGTRGQLGVVFGLTGVKDCLAALHYLCQTSCVLLLAQTSPCHQPYERYSNMNKSNGMFALNHNHPKNLCLNSYSILVTILRNTGWVFSVSCYLLQEWSTVWDIWAGTCKRGRLVMVIIWRFIRCHYLFGQLVIL